MSDSNLPIEDSNNKYSRFADLSQVDSEQNVQNQ